VELVKAEESLTAAQLCLRERLYNSAVNRAYYAMFQSAQVALERAGISRVEWSHGALQATFVSELIRRRKLYPASMANRLIRILELRLIADYRDRLVSAIEATRAVESAEPFVARVRERTQHG
jgi:uncharacterized protein (UPF0332 family)